MGFSNRIPLILGFLVLFSVLLNSLPNGLIAGVDQPNIIVPEQFDAKSISSQHYEDEETLTKNGVTQFFFNETDTVFEYVQAGWGFPYVFTGDCIEFRRIYDSYSRPRTVLLPRIYKEELLSSWDSGENQSQITLIDGKGYFIALIEDSNSTRNNIGTAFDDGELNATLVYHHDYDNQDKITSKQIIFAILQFQLPSLFITINPLMANIISVFVYVQIILVILWVYSVIIHGGF